MRIVGGKWRGKKLLTPIDSHTRPTADRHRESLFNMLDNLIAWENIYVLDAFAGTGALGLEALSRGAKHATFIENHRPATTILENNIQIASPTSTTLIKRCITSFVPQHPFDLILLDPPYYENLAKNALHQSAQWIDKEAIIVLESDPKYVPDTPDTLKIIKEKAYNHTGFYFYTSLGRP